MGGKRLALKPPLHLRQENTMNSRRSLVPATLLACALGFLPGRADAVELKIETEGHRFFAETGESGGSFDVSAMLTVLVTLNGVPVSDLGASIPINAAGISLPPAWSLMMPIGPPGPVGLS